MSNNPDHRTHESNAQTGHRTENMSKVDEYIHDIDFPCSKADLLEYASDQGAPDDVMHILEQFPDKQYASTADLARGIGAAG